MKTIDLRSDAKTFRRELDRAVASLATESPGSISAIEVGYDCDQGGWIFIHADRRAEHQRDGQWTAELDEKPLIKFPKWIEAQEANFEGEEIKVTELNGETFVVPGFDEDADQDEEEIDPLVAAIGEMIHDVLMTAKSEGAFAPLAGLGPIQLDIEDFNGGWAWPEHDDLGEVNLV